MRISISGTNLSGKSTLFNKMKSDKDFKNVGMEFLDKRNFGDYLVDNLQQGDLLLLLSADIQKLYRPDNGFICYETSLLDTYIYAKYLFIIEKIPQYIFETIGTIWINHVQHYDLILVPSHFEIPLLEDGLISINRESRDLLFRLFLEEVNKHTNLRTIMIGGTVKERMKEIKNIIL